MTIERQSLRELNTRIILRPDVRRRLRVWAAELGMTYSDALLHIMDAAQHPGENDQAAARRIARR